MKELVKKKNYGTGRGFQRTAGYDPALRPVRGSGHA